MVQLTLPKNSTVGKGRHHPAPAGAKNVKTFRELIKYQAAVEGVSIGTQVPMQDRFPLIDARLRAPALSEAFHTWKKLDMDTDFPSLFDLEFVEGARDETTTQHSREGLHQA